jgi:rubrerythrin
VIAGLLVALLACVALAYVVAPVRSGPRSERPDSALLAAEAASRKRAALTAILDLETEKEIGKLSSADFEALLAEYEAQALAALAELDALEALPSDDAIEAEIAEVRERLVCPSCGAVRAGSGSCPRCGA